MSWRRQWQPTPEFLPGESQGWRSLVGCCPRGRTESDTTEATRQQQQHCRATSFNSPFNFFFKESNLDLPTVQDYSFLQHTFFSLNTHIYAYICVFVLLRIQDFVGFGVPYSLCLHGNFLGLQSIIQYLAFPHNIDKIQQARQT